MRRGLGAVRMTALLASTCAPLGGCLAAGTGVTSVIGIPVGEGATTVARFAPDGRSALIVSARAQAGLSSSHLYVVMLPRLAPSRGWDLVGTADPATGRIDQSLSTGPRDLRAIRFARGKVGGLPATLMFVAQPEGGRGGPMTVDTYRLSTDGQDGSGMSAAFDRIHHRVLDTGYCSPEDALERVEGLGPVPGQVIGACPSA